MVRSPSASSKVRTVPTSATAPAAADVTVSCGIEYESGLPTAFVVVSNHSTVTSDYVIHVAFGSKDDPTDTGAGVATVSNIAPGQILSPSQRVSWGHDDLPGGFTCRATQVDRHAH